MRAALVMVLVGCASAQPAVPPVAIPTAPNTPVATGMEDATTEVKLYEHETVDPDNSMPTVGGYVRVRAPLSVALETATEFGDYKNLNPQYIEQSTVVDKHDDSTDLYLRVPTVIHEYVWAVVRFKPVPTRAGYAYRGDEVSGNLDDLRIYWRIIPHNGEVIAQFEFLADPHLPIPRAWIMPEVREGLRIILEHYRHKTERRARAALPPAQVADEVDFE